MSSHTGPGHRGHQHLPTGDPRATPALQNAVTSLQATPDDASARRHARKVATAYRLDENPRTRAIARGLLFVLRLQDEGDHEQASDILYNELERSFPGHGDLGPGWEAATRALPRNRR